MSDKDINVDYKKFSDFDLEKKMVVREAYRIQYKENHDGEEVLEHWLNLIFPLTDEERKQVLGEKLP